MTDRAQSILWSRGRIAFEPLMCVAILLAMGAGTALAGDADGPAVQTECPVMVGNAIKDDIFAVPEGKKVFFCCLKCKAEFAKAPEKYLPRLPQFAATGSPDGHDHTAHSGVGLADLVVPLGIATLVLVFATVMLGVFRRVKPRRMLKIHKICGVSALVVGAIHATLVLILY